MKTEREIAELIFDEFRAAKCKTGEIVMMRTIRFSLIDKLNPKEKELFDIVFVGLQLTGYFTYEKKSLDCIKLTQRGYDCIYDDEQVRRLLNTPWVIPTYKKTDWDKAYNKLWRVIGPQENAKCYIKGPDFYKMVLELTDELPPSYGGYMEYLRKKELSTSRVDYYKDLINNLDVQNRFLLYSKVQLYLESEFVSHQEEVVVNTDIIDIDTISEQEELASSTSVSRDFDESHPIVFISYSWDNKEHEDWVLKLATDLQSKYGIEIILDKWEMRLGKPLPHFMEHAITDSQRVICVMTTNYKKKTEKLVGGVGVEYSIISAEIQKDIKTEKYIPLFREGNLEDIPTFLSGRDFIDMRDDSKYDEEVKNLARDIWNEPKYKKPKLGTKPQFD